MVSCQCSKPGWLVVIAVFCASQLSWDQKLGIGFTKGGTGVVANETLLWYNTLQWVAIHTQLINFSPYSIHAWLSNLWLFMASIIIHLPMLIYMTHCTMASQICIKPTATQTTWGAIAEKSVTLMLFVVHFQAQWMQVKLNGIKMFLLIFTNLLRRSRVSDWYLDTIINRTLVHEEISHTDNQLYHENEGWVHWIWQLKTGAPAYRSCFCMLSGS